MPRKAIAPKPDAAPSADPAQLPLDEAEADLFKRIRLVALKKALAFLEVELPEDHADRPKLLMKQAEVSMAALSLTGRVDPGTLRSQATDEVGELLAFVKRAS